MRPFPFLQRASSGRHRISSLSCHLPTFSCRSPRYPIFLRTSCTESVSLRHAPMLCGSLLVVGDLCSGVSYGLLQSNLFLKIAQRIGRLMDLLLQLWNTGQYYGTQRAGRHTFTSFPLVIEIPNRALVRAVSFSRFPVGFVVFVLKPGLFASFNPVVHKWVRVNIGNYDDDESAYITRWSMSFSMVSGWASTWK